MLLSPSTKALKRSLQAGHLLDHSEKTASGRRGGSGNFQIQKRANWETKKIKCKTITESGKNHHLSPFSEGT